ncbi:MAG: methyltransferase domain-containing protein, partial [Bdellovibrionales bacterium]|nr:methyltransferase domain-containing protein [Bdellovibrionales bacterium]
EYTSNPDLYFDRVCVECNYLDAVKLVNWDSYIPENARILDLAGGTGWLSAYLSTFKKVKNITIIDASKNYLEVNMPVSVRKLNGSQEKIKAIQGYFAPLLVEDNSYDMVVVSSSLHHADNLGEVIKELHRVLVPGGKCMILNETPAGNVAYLKTMLMAFVRIFTRTLKQTFMYTSPSISSSGFLYDPLLGDRMFPDWYWVKAIELAGFKLEKRIDSNMATVKNMKGTSLVHYVCSKGKN